MTHRRLYTQKHEQQPWLQLSVGSTSHTSHTRVSQAQQKPQPRQRRAHPAPHPSAKGSQGNLAPLLLPELCTFLPSFGAAGDISGLGLCIANSKQEICHSENDASLMRLSAETRLRGRVMDQPTSHRSLGTHPFAHPKILREPLTNPHCAEEHPSPSQLQSCYSVCLFCSQQEKGKTKNPVMHICHKVT